MRVIKRLKLFYITILCTLFISACGPIVDLGGEASAHELFTLTNDTQPIDQRLATPAKIFIEEPGAATHLSTTHIAVRIDNTEVKYLPLARWSDQPARLVREQLQISLEKVEGLTPLGASALEVPTDYRLKLHLRAFNAQEDQNELCPYSPL